MVDINEIKKDLYKSKAVAKLLYYEPSNGDLVYTINALGKDWVFPIHTITKVYNWVDTDDGLEEVESFELTDDLKGARFEPEIKGSSLIRWIQQAIEKNEFH